MGLLERDVELGAIAEALAAPPRLLIAEGAAGLGKSRLLGAVCERAAAGGASVLRARGAELERAVAFGAARQLFEPLLIGGVPPEELFAGPAELARPVFELTEDPEGDPCARIHGLYWLAVNLTRSAPLVVAVDDLQWCDDASVRFLVYLARRLYELPIVVALADARALGAAFAEPGAVRLRPAALGEESVAVLARRNGLDPGDAFLAACLRATGGNPFLLGELLREVGEPSEVAVDRIGPQVVAARIAGLDPAAAEVARALAILGDGAGLDAVAALAGDDFAAEAALRLEAESVVTRDGGLAFVHPIVRRAVLAGMGAVETERRHAAAAALLAERGAPSREVAAHLLRTEPAGDRDRVAVLYAAATEAAGLGDPAAAAELLRRAAAEAPPREELLVELGEAERRAGAGTATATLEAAMVEAGDLALYARAVESLADVHMRSGRALRAAYLLEEAVERLAGTPDAERLAIQLIGAGHVSIAARRHLDGRIRALALPEGEPRTSADLMALAAGAWGAIVDHGDAGLARELGARVLGFSGEADVAAISALIMTTVALAAAEDLATAGRVQENMLGGARRRGAIQGVVALSSLVALTRWRAGDVAGSVDAADAALELGAEIIGAEMLTHAGVAAALLAGLDAGRDPEALLGTLRTANLRRDADLLAWSQVLIGEAAVHAARGDHAAALDRLRACDLAGSGWGRDCPSLVPWRSGAALSLAATGAQGDAAELAEEEVELARRAGTPRAQGWALRARALVGPASARREGLERALAVLEPLGTPAVTARVRTDLGAQLRRDGERSAARELLSVARGQAVACGAQAIADAAAAELRGIAG